MKNCPTCGQDMPLIADMIVRKDLLQASYRGETRHIDPQGAAILAELAARVDEIVPQDQLLLAMYGADEGPKDPVAVLKVKVTYVRRMIAGWPYLIEGIYDRGYVLRRLRRPLAGLKAVG